jgi:hypothetical protein
MDVGREEEKQEAEKTMQQYLDDAIISVNARRAKTEIMNESTTKRSNQKEQYSYEQFKRINTETLKESTSMDEAITEATTMLNELMLADKGKREAGPLESVIALSSTCTRMRAIASDMHYPLLRLVMPVNEDGEIMSSFISFLLREERRFDRIMVICASFSVLHDLRNATKELCLPPDDMRISNPKVSLHFPTIMGNYDVTTSIESLLFKHIHDELSTYGSQMFTARTIQEMHSLGYKWENNAYNYYGNGFICGERNQREVKIIFIVYLNNIDKPNCYVRLVSMRRYSGHVAEVTNQVRWYENLSTWLGIALRLYHDAIGWEDAKWEFEDGSTGDY